MVYETVHNCLEVMYNKENGKKTKWTEKGIFP